MFSLKKIKVEIVFIYAIIIFSAILAPSFLISNKNEIYIYLIKPVIWICIFLITVLLECDSRAKFNKKNDVIKTIFIFSLLYIVIYYMLGLISGYNKTPYLLTFLGISKNIWAIVMVACLQEYVRSVLVSNSFKSKIELILITLTFILIDINWKSFINSFVSVEETFKYMCNTMIPLILKNISYTYIVCYIGCFGSIINRFLILLFSVITPIIPNVGWFFEGIIQIISSFILMIVVNYELTSKNLDISRNKIKKENPLRQLPFLIISIIFVLFIVGIFKYKPLAVMSNSMVPVFSRGSIVIVEKVDEKEIEKLKVGDIIEYSTENTTVIHRIEEIVDEKNNIYITKGDNNKNSDKKQVYANQIKGIVRFYIPYVGYPSVWFSEIINKNKSLAEIELGN